MCVFIIVSCIFRLWRAHLPSAEFLTMACLVVGAQLSAAQPMYQKINNHGCFLGWTCLYICVCVCVKVQLMGFVCIRNMVWKEAQTTRPCAVQMGLLSVCVVWVLVCVWVSQGLDNRAYISRWTGGRKVTKCPVALLISPLHLDCMQSWQICECTGLYVCAHMCGLCLCPCVSHNL